MLDSGPPLPWKEEVLVHLRQVQARPLRELRECLSRLSLRKKGVFVPDATSSGMFTEPAYKDEDPVSSVKHQTRILLVRLAP